MEFLDEYVQVRLTPSDKVKIKEKAAENKMAVSTYCRIKLLGEL
tara:strand:+ start:318 stop:449 length:132 start_codon:yes stop_codon:yes gene_type:complete